jgi:hypothetical protein
VRGVGISEGHGWPLYMITNSGIYSVLLSSGNNDAKSGYIT